MITSELTSCFPGGVCMWARVGRELSVVQSGREKADAAEDSVLCVMVSSMHHVLKCHRSVI